MIANTILQQLGGHGFTVMTGSRNYINLGNGLQMSLARNKTSANRLKIILIELRISVSLKLKDKVFIRLTKMSVTFSSHNISMFSIFISISCIF